MWYVPFVYDNFVYGAIIAIGVFVGILATVKANRRAETLEQMRRKLIKIAAVVFVVLAAYTAQILMRQCAEKAADMQTQARLSKRQSHIQYDFAKPEKQTSGLLVSRV